jgi:hypothetical protein
VVLGELQDRQNRALDIATLSNRPDIDVMVDGHAVVSRHLAILAMTGAGKSWTARRTIEELARKNYPIVIFDPHGDYSGLSEVPELCKRVKRFYATFPVFEEDAETVASIVNTLGYELTPAMHGLFDEVFSFAKNFLVEDMTERQQRVQWLVAQLNSDYVTETTVRRDMHMIGHLAEVAQLAIQQRNGEAIQQLIDWGWTRVGNYSKTDAKTLEGMKKRCRKAAVALRRMEQTNRRVAGTAEPLPRERTDLVRYGQISVVSLAGYTGDFQATIYSLIAEEVFEKKVSGDLPLPALFLLEEAHNFAPAQPRSDAEKRSITTTRQIAQEGRKFGVGLVIISQRPSRLDETTLSQCNSFVIMRMVNPADQSFVRRVIETLGEDEAKLLPDLDVGEALLSGRSSTSPSSCVSSRPCPRASTRRRTLSRSSKRSIGPRAERSGDRRGRMAHAAEIQPILVTATGN